MEKTVHHDKKLYMREKVLNYILAALKCNKNILYGGASMKSISKIIVKVVDKTLQREADSACIIFGYQPVMPKEVKEFKKVKRGAEC